MNDRYELVARRLSRSLTRDWLFVAAASITLGGAVGALAVGSSSLHTMVALAAPEVLASPSPSLVLDLDDERFNTDDDNDLPAACRDAEKAANHAEQLAAEAERRAEKLAEQAERLADSVDDCDAADDPLTDENDESVLYDET